MKWFFQPRPTGDGATQDEDDSSPGLISLPDEVLQRHGARVLDPGKAAAVPGSPTPRPTIYKARTLLVPGDLAHDTMLTDALNAVLREVRMMLIPPPAEDEDRTGDGEVMEVLRRLPRPAVLVPAEGTTKPVVVDAWTALQALRAAAAAPEHPDVSRATLEQLRATVEQIGLEHLLCAGTIINGSPISGGGGAIPGGSGNGVAGPTSTDSYLFNGGDARTPVAVVMQPPARRSAKRCVSKYGRRPVLAILDTGPREHWWLDVQAKPGGGYKTLTDGFVQIDPGLQDAIRVESQHAAETGDQPRQVIKDSWDGPASDDPLIGELDSDTGHFTFEAGIVRQVVPDAQVLAVRVMHSDGVVYEGDLICALRHLAKRIVRGRANDIAAHVDVLSLSLGFFSESPHDAAIVFGLHKVINALRSLGVVVVAAAGNYSTTRRFYPAAFAEPPTGEVPLISVGALNPNGSKAVFSDGGGWINTWASGAMVVSTFPTDVNASRTPELRMRAHPANQLPPDVSLPGERESLDYDDYSGGFGVWSGSSFSAPLVAAHITAALLNGAASNGALKLNLRGAADATKRALAALASLCWPQ
jgi:subtilisin family serine protease